MKKEWNKLAEVITSLCNYEPEEIVPEEIEAKDMNTISLGESMDLT